MNATFPSRKRQERDFSPVRGEKGPRSLLNRRTSTITNASTASEPAELPNASKPDEPTLLEFDETVNIRAGTMPRAVTGVLDGLPAQEQNVPRSAKPRFHVDRFSMPAPIPSLTPGQKPTQPVSQTPSMAAKTTANPAANKPRSTPLPASARACSQLPNSARPARPTSRSLGVREERDLVTELQNELFRVKQEFAEYRDSVEKFPPDLERAHAELVERDDIIVELRKKNWGLKAENTKLNSDYQQQQRLHQQQLRDLQQQPSSEERLQQLKRVSETKIASLSDVIKKLQAQLSTMQADLNESRQKELQAQGAPSAHSNVELTVARANAARNQKKIKQLEEDVDRLNHEVAGLEVNRDSAMAEAQRMSDQKRVAEDSARSRVREVESKMSQMRSELEAKYASSTDERVRRVEDGYSKRFQDLEVQLGDHRLAAETAKQALKAAESRLADVTSTTTAASRLSDERRGQLQRKFDNLFADSTRQQQELSLQAEKLRAQIQGLQTELATATNLAHSKMTELEVARSQLESSRETAQKVQATLEKELQELRQSAHEQASQVLDQHTGETERLQDLIYTKEKRLSELTEELSVLKKATQDRNYKSTTKIEDLERQVLELTASSQDLSISLDKATKRASQAERAYGAASEQETKLQAVIATLHMEKTEWGTQVKQLEAEKMRLEVKLEHARQHSPSRSEMESEQALRAKISTLEAELATSRTRFQDMGEQWGTEQSRLQAEISGLKDQVTELSSDETARFERRWEVNRKAIESAYTLKLQAADQSAGAMEQQLQSLMAQLSDAQRGLQTRQESITRVEQELNSARIAARGAHLTSQTTEATCQQLRDHIDVLSKTVEQLQQELADSVRLKNSSAESVSQLTSERSDLIRQAAAEIDNLREKLKAAEAETLRIRTTGEEQLARERTLANQNVASAKEQAQQELAAERKQYEDAQRGAVEALAKENTLAFESYQKNCIRELDARVHQVEESAQAECDRLDHHAEVAVEYGRALRREMYMGKKTLEFTQSVASYGWDRAEYYRNQFLVMDGIVPAQRTLRNAFLAGLAIVRWRKVVGTNYYHRVSPHLEQEFSRLC